MSDTPETDAFVKELHDDFDVELAEMTSHARRLERKLCEARHEIEGWRNKWDCAVEMGALAQVERDEAREFAHRFRWLYYTQLGIQNSASWFPWEAKNE
jgi:hypothetical protein